MTHGTEITHLAALCSINSEILEVWVGRMWIMTAYALELAVPHKDIRNNGNFRIRGHIKWMAVGSRNSSYI